MSEQYTTIGMHSFLDVVHSVINSFCLLTKTKALAAEQSTAGQHA